MQGNIPKVNIPASINDEFYRYKRRILKVKVESSGNGIKTRLVNLDEIAQDLDRNDSALLKYFSIQLGSAIKITKNAYLLNGQFNKKNMKSILEKYIQEYVLCGKCKNPETTLNKSKKKIQKQCKSCGGLSNCPNDSKYLNFVRKLLNETNDTHCDSDASEKTDKSSKRHKRKDKKKRKHSNGDGLKWISQDKNFVCNLENIDQTAEKEKIYLEMMEKIYKESNNVDNFVIGIAQEFPNHIHDKKDEIIFLSAFNAFFKQHFDNDTAKQRFNDFMYFMYTQKLIDEISILHYYENNDENNDFVKWLSHK